MLSPLWMKKSGIALTHRFVNLHPAEAGVDAPPLAGGVAAPLEAQIGARTPTVVPIATVVSIVTECVRRHDQAAGDRLADRAVVVEALERDAHEDISARLEPVDALSRGEVGGLERVRPDKAVPFAKLLVVRPLDQHASRAIAPAPDDDGAVRGIAELQTLQRLRTLAFGGDDRGCPPGQAPRGQHSTGGGGDTGLQKFTTR